jgi:hypothetical protein
MNHTIIGFRSHKEKLEKTAGYMDHTIMDFRHIKKNGGKTSDMYHTYHYGL